MFLWSNPRVYSSENSHKATSNVDLTSRVGPLGTCKSTGPSSRLSDFCWLVSHLPDWPVLSTGSFCSLLLTVFFCLLSDLPVSWEISCSGSLWGFNTKTVKRILWLVPIHTTTQRMPNIVSRMTSYLKPYEKTDSITWNHMIIGIWLEYWRCPWCNGYHRWKWTRRHKFKSWTRLIAFHIALIPLGKVWIQIFYLQVWVNSRTDWVLHPWWGNKIRRRKSLNSNLLISA